MADFKFGGSSRGKVFGPGGKIRKLVAARGQRMSASNQGPSVDQENRKEEHRRDALAKLTGEALTSSTAGDTKVDTVKQQRRCAGNFTGVVQQARVGEQQDAGGNADKQMATKLLIAARRQTPMYPNGRVPAKPLALVSKSKRLDIVVDTTRHGEPAVREIEIAAKASKNRAGQTSPEMRQLGERPRHRGPSSR